MKKPPACHYFGPKKPGQLLVCVHGLGVNYASAGLFTGLAARLTGSGLGCLLFDLNDYSEREIRLQPLKTQVARLQAVVDYANRAYPASQAICLGHSFGCLVLADWVKTRPAWPLIFLAPARPDVGKLLEPYLRRRRGSYVGENATLFVPRQSGRLSVYEAEYFRDLAAIDPGVYGTLSLASSLVVLASADYGRSDGHLWSSLVDAGAKVLESGHNFSGSHVVLARLIDNYASSVAAGPLIRAGADPANSQSG